MIFSPVGRSRRKRATAPQQRPGYRAEFCARVKGKRQRKGPEAIAPGPSSRFGTPLPEEVVIDGQNATGPDVDQDGVPANPDPLRPDRGVVQSVVARVQVVARAEPAERQEVA